MRSLITYWMARKLAVPVLRKKPWQLSGPHPWFILVPGLRNGDIIRDSTADLHKICCIHVSAVEH